MFEDFLKLGVRHGSAFEGLAVVFPRLVEAFGARAEDGEIVVGFAGQRIGGDGGLEMGLRLRLAALALLASAAAPAAKK